MWVAYKNGKQIAKSVTYKSVFNVVNAHKFSQPNATYVITIK